MSWTPLCTTADLIADAGVALHHNGRQIALFWLPRENPSLYAIDHYDPASGANVLARGIVGDIGGELVVASPLHKQHYALHDGHCLDGPWRVNAYPVRLDGEQVLIDVPRQAAA